MSGPNVSDVLLYCTMTERALWLVCFSISSLHCWRMVCGDMMRVALDCRGYVREWMREGGRE